jgi:unsaturated rhamnogalacturonyl hydrolase
MMWALFSVEYGLFSNNEELEEFGLSQPAIFAERLRDDKTGLFHHAWNIESDSLCPEDNAIWLRGNAWVMVSILEMISSINESDIRYGELCSMFQGLAESSLSYRQTSGYWDTVMSKPGFAYEESSGSALIAYAYAKGSRLGLIDDSYFYIAIDTFSSITSRLKKSSSGYAVEDVSSGTIPSNRYGYKLVPRGSNIPYGAGAYILLASELVNAGYR